jgi:hypothetical protein
MHVIKKVKQESDIGQGLRTSMIKKHGKNTEIRTSTVSIEAVRQGA